jgi:hypothetical protein
MSKILNALKAAKALLTSVKLSQEQLKDGTIIQYDGDELAKNEVIYVQDGNKDFSVAADGEYETKNGAKFTITDGVCTAVDDSAVADDEDEDEKKPKKQAQTKKKKVAAGDEGKKKKVKADDADIAAPGAGANLPDDEDEPEEDDELEEDADETPAVVPVTVNVSDVVSAALQPVYQQIYDLQSIVSSLKDLVSSQKAIGEQTQAALSKVADTVAVISNQPAGSPIETEVQGFTKKEKTESRAMKIFAAGANADYNKNVQNK